MDVLCDACCWWGESGLLAWEDGKGMASELAVYRCLDRYLVERTRAVEHSMSAGFMAVSEEGWAPGELRARRVFLARRSAVEEQVH